MSRFYTEGAGRASSPDPELEYDQSRGRYTDTSAMRPLRNDYQPEPSYREPSFDVRADFDGLGPRWSETHGVAKHETYRPVYDHDAAALGGGGGGMDGSGSGLGFKMHEERDPEMVSVPVLGPEWTKAELRGISNRGKNDRVRDRRVSNWRAWNRDQKGCCGVRWLTRTVFVFFVFFFLAALIVTLYFTIPRAVKFEFFQAQPLSIKNDTLVFNRVPTNFSFDADLQLMADASSSYVPVQIKADATVLDLRTSKVIAKGTLERRTLPHTANQPIRFPVTFEYAAVNTSDATWDYMYKACQHRWPGVERGDIELRVEVKQSIIGVVGHPISASTVHSVPCPAELGTDSV